MSGAAHGDRDEADQDRAVGRGEGGDGGGALGSVRPEHASVGDERLPGRQDAGRCTQRTVSETTLCAP